MALCAFSHPWDLAMAPGLGISPPFCGKGSLECVWGDLLLIGGTPCWGRPWLLLLASYYVPGPVPDVVGTARSRPLPTV